MSQPARPTLRHPDRTRRTSTRPGRLVVIGLLTLAATACTPTHKVENAKALARSFSMADAFCVMSSKPSSDASGTSSDGPRTTEVSHFTCDQGSGNRFEVTFTSYQPAIKDPRSVPVYAEPGDAGRWSVMYRQNGNRVVRGGAIREEGGRLVLRYWRNATDPTVAGYGSDRNWGMVLG